ncbi:hypothetical protein BC628DRAFT_752822 [Trametes gibbosa]|nr:hypothetical protein BC628DRAFT_752822 [Trametes gibbosa]
MSERRCREAGNEYRKRREQRAKNGRASRGGLDRLPVAAGIGFEPKRPPPSASRPSSLSLSHPLPASPSTRHVPHPPACSPRLFPQPRPHSWTLSRPAHPAPSQARIHPSACQRYQPPFTSSDWSLPFIAAFRSSHRQQFSAISVSTASLAQNPIMQALIHAEDTYIPQADHAFDGQPPLDIPRQPPVFDPSPYALCNLDHIPFKATNRPVLCHQLPDPISPPSISPPPSLGAHVTSINTHMRRCAAQKENLPRDVPHSLRRCLAPTSGSSPSAQSKRKTETGNRHGQT